MEKMREGGALTAMMSGSGPTVFGLFEEKEAAGAAGIVLKETYPGAEIFLTGFADRNDL